MKLYKMVPTDRHTDIRHIKGLLDSPDWTFLPYTIWVRIRATRGRTQIWRRKISSLIVTLALALILTLALALTLILALTLTCHTTQSRQAATEWYGLNAQPRLAATVH